MKDEVKKAASLVLNGSTPITAAAKSLSRIATSARPKELRLTFMKNTVSSTAQPSASQ